MVLIFKAAESFWAALITLKVIIDYVGNYLNKQTHWELSKLRYNLWITFLAYVPVGDTSRVGCSSSYVYQVFGFISALIFALPLHLS